MNVKASLLIPLSILLGLGAVQTGRTWLERQVDQRAQMLEPRPHEPAIDLVSVVVARQPLGFGEEITPAKVKEISWPREAAPDGAFASAADLFVAEGRRVALAAIGNNEPVLASRVTGPGQKANLAALIEPGMKAVTVRVDDVVGVAGFVLPGDRVDVLLTRRSGDKAAFADAILQNLRVLAIDQKADSRLDQPTLARAVTIEVTIDQAQRLTVAQQVGTLTLVLRPIGETRIEPGQRVTSGQLADFRSLPVEEAAHMDHAPGPASATVNVIRGSNREEYSVPAAARMSRPERAALRNDPPGH